MLFALAALLISDEMQATPRTAQACDYRVEHAIAFTGPAANDSAVAEIIGENCEQAAVLYHIFDGTGRRVFFGASTVEFLWSSVGEPPTRDQLVRFLSTNALHVGPTPARASDLPEQPRGHDVGDGFCLSADPVTYIRARTDGGPLITVMEDPEYPTYLWYDDLTGRAVRLGTGCY